jgi:hypothetical protein
MFGFLFRRKEKTGVRRRSESFWVYAGEFLLVFLGILIALQVENWSQDHKDRKLERVLLSEMLHNLEADLEDLEYNSGMQQRFLNSSQLVLEFLQSNGTWHDSLGRHFSQLMAGSVFDSNNSAYESLKSIGIDLVRNDSLRQQITLVYTARYTKLKTTHDLLFTYIFDHLYPSLRANLHTVIPRELTVPVNLENLRMDNGFIEELNMTIFIYRLFIGTCQEAREAIIELIEEIEKELS